MPEALMKFSFWIILSIYGGESKKGPYMEEYSSKALEEVHKLILRAVVGLCIFHNVFIAVLEKKST